MSSGVVRVRFAGSHEFSNHNFGGTVRNQQRIMRTVMIANINGSSLADFGTRVFVRLSMAALLVLLFSGCESKLSKRIEDSRTALKKLYETEKNPFFKELDSRALERLELYAQDPGSMPWPLAAGFIRVDRGNRLQAHWATQKPMVDSVEVLNPATGRRLELQLEDFFIEENKNIITGGTVLGGSVIGECAWNWFSESSEVWDENYQVPELLLEENLQIILKSSQYPEWQSDPIDIYWVDSRTVDAEERIQKFVE